MEWVTVPKSHQRYKNGAKGPRKHESATGRMGVGSKDRHKNRPETEKALGGRNAGNTLESAISLSGKDAGETRKTAGLCGDSEKPQVTEVTPLKVQLAGPKEVPDHGMAKRPRYSDDFPALGRTEESRQKDKTKGKR